MPKGKSKIQYYHLDTSFMPRVKEVVKELEGKPFDAYLTDTLLLLISFNILIVYNFHFLLFSYYLFFIYFMLFVILCTINLTRQRDTVTAELQNRHKEYERKPSKELRKMVEKGSFIYCIYFTPHTYTHF